MTVPKVWAAYRKLYMQNYSYNGEVTRYFSRNTDSNDLDETKKLCLIQATDSRATAMLRQEVFYHRVLKTHLRSNDWKTPESDNGDVIYRPQINFYFREDKRAVVEGNPPLEAEISIRLMDETTSSFTEAKMKILARDIAVELAQATPLKFKKGKMFCYYKDKERGYDFRVLALNEDEGERVIKSILKIQNHTYDPDLFRHSTPKRSNTVPPKTKTVLGKVRKLNRWRPNAIVEFLWADLYLHGLKPSEQPTLVDRSGTKKNPVLHS